MTIQPNRRAEFEEWLQTHSAHLSRYEAWEVARLALYCGFSMADVAPSTVNWLSKSQRWLKLWQSPFAEQWASLSGYDHGRDWETK